MPFFTTKSIKLYYEYNPAPDRETILLLSGIVVDHNFWYPIVSYLEGKYNLLLVDNLGSGQSSLSPHPSTRDMASHVAALLEHLQLSSINLVGHGIGGMTAQWLAIDHSKYFKNLFLYSTTAHPLDAQPMAFNGELFEHQQFDLAIKNIALWSFSPALCNDQEKFSNVIAILKTSGPSPEGGIPYQMQSYITHDARQELSKISTPTFILAGERDRISMLPDAYELQQLIPGAVLKIFAGMANSTHSEIPEEFCNYVDSCAKQYDHKEAIDFSQHDSDLKTKSQVKKKQIIESNALSGSGMYMTRGRKRNAQGIQIMPEQTLK